jgi:hypothetical protein
MVTGLSACELSAENLKWWLIEAIIQAIAITAPAIKIMSYDDLSTDFLVIGINPPKRLPPAQPAAALHPSSRKSWTARFLKRILITLAGEMGTL